MSNAATFIDEHDNRVTVITEIGVEVIVPDIAGPAPYVGSCLISNVA